MPTAGRRIAHRPTPHVAFTTWSRRALRSRSGGLMLNRPQELLFRLTYLGTAPPWQTSGLILATNQRFGLSRCQSPNLRQAAEIFPRESDSVSARNKPELTAPP